MYCQKCRIPLQVDSTLDDLNPAAFDLLVGSAVKAQQNATPQTHLNYPAERKALYDRVAKQGSSPLQRRTIPPPHGDEDAPDAEATGTADKPLPADMSFIEITESQIVVPKSSSANKRNHNTATKGKSEAIGDDEKNGEVLSARMMKNEKLFAILSAHSDIDHPICSECTSLLLQSYSAKLASATRERDAYAGFLKQLQQNSTAHTEEGRTMTEKELVQLKQQDQDSFEELLQLEKEKADLEAELADLEEQSHQLDLEEESFWRDRNAFDEETHELNSTLISLQQKFAHDQQQLDKLQRSNVYNDTFYISHDGYFGTINGLRLGRLAAQNVEWAEINAAWGQTLLLLTTVAERLNFTFQGYRLKPLGSTSRIEKLEYPQQPPVSLPGSSTAAEQRLREATPASQPKVTPLDLFSSGETAVGRMFNHRRFDAGMVAFLECLAQVCKHVERSSSSTTRDRAGLDRQTSKASAQQPGLIPYRFDGDKIGGVSIKLGMGIQQDENFTKACKHALTCCKYLLAHISNMDNPKV